MKKNLEDYLKIYHNSLQDDFCKSLTEKLEKNHWELHGYYDVISNTSYNTWSGFTGVRFNRYDETTEMRNHCDHIHSIFDGERKGIPTLTVLGGLNNEYEGGELVLWEDTKIELPAGSIAVFPSNFLYPHKVDPITSGTRYSFVSWVW